MNEWLSIVTAGVVVGSCGFCLGFKLTTDRAKDKIEGLSADLDSAVEVAYKRGAVEWTRLNYPTRYAILSRMPSLPKDNG